MTNAERPVLGRNTRLTLKMKKFKKPARVKNTGTTDALRQLRAREFEQLIRNELLNSKTKQESRRKTGVGANRTE